MRLEGKTSARYKARDPSLAACGSEIVEEIYRDALFEDSVGACMSIETFPENCPYKSDQLRDHDFRPE
ncbi:hypothetical protein FP2506_14834 [Fulvimarina pelagi HTCC2506]|uniref:Uncharacterized protein n=1 Tax=Fulvimarina pelagi HTCC2506 TaxID=314231 RepID=Q0G3W3_9HYPH|nr:DUF29 family protein [Fulvimarina pelagi]EAU41718.1 hypothetical protein FP2506_14834 [Fulvimarina pelagi HTCC2506]